MSEAALRAEYDAEWAAIDARCAASPRKASLFAAFLRTRTHAESVKRLFNSAAGNYATLMRLQLADGHSPNTVDAGRSTLVGRCYM